MKRAEAAALVRTANRDDIGEGVGVGSRMMLRGIVRECVAEEVPSLSVNMPG